jgi:hypothetical protein
MTGCCLLCDRCQRIYRTENLASPLCFRCMIACDAVEMMHAWARPLTTAELQAAAGAARGEPRYLRHLTIVA